MEDNNEDEKYETMIDINNMIKVSPFVDRYFVKFYYPWKRQGLIVDHYAFQHTNRLVMVGLSKRHFLIENQLKIQKIEYPSLKGGDENVKVRGKKKKGGLLTNMKTLIARITCENHQEFDVKAMVHGSLIEVNEKIMADPTILLKYPESFGYICILNQARHQEKIENYKYLVDKDQYQSLGSDFYNDVLGDNGWLDKRTLEAQNPSKYKHSDFCRNWSASYKESDQNGSITLELFENGQFKYTGYYVHAGNTTDYTTNGTWKIKDDSVVQTESEFTNNELTIVDEDNKERFLKATIVVMERNLNLELKASDLN